jgi:hypothetical protein
MDLEHFLKIHAIHMTLDGICFTDNGFLKPLPFYSHRWDNTPSQAVARSLQLTLYATDVGYF